MNTNAAGTTYYSLINECAPDIENALIGVIRLTRTDGRATPALFTPRTNDWQVDGSLMDYISGRDPGASEIDEAEAAAIVGRWGGRLDGGAA